MPFGLHVVEEKFIPEFATMIYDDSSLDETIKALRSEAVECRLKVLHDHEGS